MWRRMKCAEPIRTEDDIHVMQQVNVESAIVYTASEHGTIGSHADRAAAIFDDFLKVRSGILILEE